MMPCKTNKKSRPLRTADISQTIYNHFNPRRGVATGTLYNKTKIKSKQKNPPPVCQHKERRKGIAQTNNNLYDTTMTWILYHRFVCHAIERMNKFMKNPNGYGTVVKLSGNRRNPYTARKTTGWNDKGHPVYLVIGYYPTREAGMIALAQYNNNPWDIERGKTTFQELYNLWLEKKAPKLGKENIISLKSAFTHCKDIYNVKYKDIRTHHMQNAIDGCDGYSVQSKIKNLFYHLDRFAMELDLTNKRYSELTTVLPVPETSKEAFTEDEIKSLWEIQDEPYVDTVLIFLYTGFRVSELLGIEKKNVNLTDGTIQGGIKTKAGKDRIVPIHSKIEPFITKRVNGEGEYLISNKSKKVSKSTYYDWWWGVMSKINASHTVHETRHTFRSRLDSAGANKRCIDLIMGHKSNDVGERVYTHKTIEELKETIELITR